MLKLKVLVYMTEYRIKFSYTTRRDNHRTNEFSISYPCGSTEESIKNAFLEGIASYNETHPQHTYSNVKILEVCPTDIVDTIYV